MLGLSRLRANLLALCPLAILGIAGGCASPVPGQSSATTGKQIIVTITCNGTMYPQFYYYFLINRVGQTGNINGSGPIPVVGTGIPNLGGYGNGFATGSTPAVNSSDFGLTDYVLYTAGAGTSGIGIGVYHINGNPNVPNPGTPNGTPLNVSLPDPTGQSGQPNVLSFQLPVTQLVTDTTDPKAKLAEANAIQYLQVNIVATNVVPTSQASGATKVVDAMGNTTNDATTYLTIDLTQNRTYTDTNTNANLIEPVGDEYPPGSPNATPSIDLIHWSIQVVQQ